MVRYPHHEKTIQLYVDRNRGDEGILGIVLGGSIAKGMERPDSDVDLMVCVTDERYAQLQAQAHLTDCIMEETYYPGGMYDIKYCALDYLKQCADHGSEPARNAYAGARVLFSRQPGLEEIVKRIPVFQKGEQAEKLFSFYSTLELSQSYYWDCCVMGQDNPYLKVRTAADIALCGLRLFLQEQEVLFPCQRRLMATVRAQPGGAQLADAAERFLRTLEDADEKAFRAAVEAAVRYRPPENYDEVVTRHVTDVELWWYKDRPNLVEW